METKFVASTQSIAATSENVELNNHKLFIRNQKALTNGPFKFQKAAFKTAFSQQIQKGNWVSNQSLIPVNSSIRYTGALLFNQFYQHLSFR
jgi:hypothetical protein